MIPDYIQAVWDCQRYELLEKRKNDRAEKTKEIKKSIPTEAPINYQFFF